MASQGGSSSREDRRNQSRKQKRRYEELSSKLTEESDMSVQAKVADLDQVLDMGAGDVAPEVGVKDAKLFGGVIIMTNAQLKKQVTGGGIFTANEFKKRLKLRYTIEDADADDASLDWNRVNREAASFFAITPALNFLGNPFAKGQKEKKVREGSMRRKKREDAVATRTAEQMDTAADQKNSRLRERQILTQISDMQEDVISLPRLFVDPTSFGETAENLFSCVFLMNQQYLIIDKDEHRGLVARKTKASGAKGSAPTQSQAQAGRFIPKLDYNIFQELVKRHNITQPWFKFDPKMNQLKLRDIDFQKDEIEQSQSSTQLA